MNARVSRTIRPHEGVTLTLDIPIEVDWSEYSLDGEGVSVDVDFDIEPITNLQLDLGDIEMRAKIIDESWDEDGPPLSPQRPVYEPSEAPTEPFDPWGAETARFWSGSR